MDEPAPHHSGMRVVRVTEQQIQHEWLTLANVPETIDQAFESRSKGRRNSLLRPTLDKIMNLPTSRSELSPSTRPAEGVPLPQRLKSASASSESSPADSVILPQRFKSASAST